MDKSISIIKDVMGDLYFPHIDLTKECIVKNIREITISSGKPVIFYSGNECFYKDKYSGHLTKNYYDAIVVCDEYISELLSRITGNSPYMFQNSFSKGYIPFHNGIRVSVTGDGYTDTEGQSILKKVNSLSFRISRNIPGVSDKCFGYITDGEKIYNSLIISPPACGKTTLLRDIAKRLSVLFRTGIADEREEICIDDMGVLSMVIKGIPKKDAFEMFIRNSSADVIICDEIGGICDSQLIFEAMKRGVNVVASAHGKSYDDIKSNPLTKDIYSLFDTLIFLSPKKGKGEIEEIYFGGEKCLSF